MENGYQKVIYPNFVAPPFDIATQPLRDLESFEQGFRLQRPYLPFYLWTDESGESWRVDVLGDGTAVTWCVDE